MLYSELLALLEDQFTVYEASGRKDEDAKQLISKGRFEKSEPTIHQGQDLDVPTYIRRGVPLN